MNERGKSDGRVVPAKQTNKAALASGGGVGGGKAPSRGEHGRQNASRTQSRTRRAQCAGPYT
jgi:hypothetical protein